MLFFYVFVLVFFAVIATKMFIVYNMSMVDTIKFIGFLFLLLMAIYGLIYAISIVSDYCFLLNLIKFTQRRGIGATWDRLVNRRGARIHWTVLQEPVNCLFLSTLLEEVGRYRENADYLELAGKMRQLAVAADPRLMELAREKSTITVANRYHEYAAKRSLLRCTYSLLQIPAIKISVWAIMSMAILLFCALQILKVFNWL